MVGTRTSHTATLLRDGRVLLIAGDRHHRVLRSAELYNPRTGRFSPTGRLLVRRHKHAAVLLPSGRVLVLGGSDERDWDGRYRSAELYDPQTGRFSKAAPMTSPHFKFAAGVVRLDSGAVLVAGGWDIYETYRAGRFATTARLDVARYFSTATKLDCGAVLVAGGYDRAIRPTADAFLYRS